MIGVLMSILGLPKFRVVAETDPGTARFFWVEMLGWLGWGYVHGTYSEDESLSKSKALEIIRNYNWYDISHRNALNEAVLKDLDK